MPNTKRAIARRNLDERLASLKPVAAHLPPPRGWIRALREALGMSARQLGQRLGVKQQSVMDFEASEAQGSIQINTLMRVAEALDCTLVYALVPRTSFEEMVATRARSVAREQLVRIGHSMDLEAQGLPAAELDAQVDEFVERYVRDRDLWD
jgi:predicted DNA-binding mobile mystery protein A